MTTNHPDSDNPQSGSDEGLAARTSDALKSKLQLGLAMFGVPAGVEHTSSFIDETGRLIGPAPSLTDAELKELDTLTQQYEDLIAPGWASRLSSKTSDLIPESARKIGTSARESLRRRQLYTEALKVASDGFGELEKRAASFSVSQDYVITKINGELNDQTIGSLQEITLLPADTVRKIARKDNIWHLTITGTDGAITGFFGFAGIPANLALSNLLLFRAIQSVAMFYGYDVKNDPAELEIASQVLTSSLNPSAQGATEIEAIIGKVLVFSEASAIKQTAAKGWLAMAERGGIALALTQMRALANAAARKALEKSGQKALEATVFRTLLEQIGRRATLKNVGKVVPGMGAIFGLFFDVGAMKKVLDYADLFYAKRFILEKPERVAQFVDGPGIIAAGKTIDSGDTEATPGASTSGS